MENTLLNSILNRKSADYSSIWRIMNNFEFTDKEQIYQYCLENNLIIDETDKYDIHFSFDLPKFYERKLANKIFNKTAVIKHNKYYNFGISPFTAELYGCKKEDILTVALQIVGECYENPKLDSNEFYFGFYSFQNKIIDYIYDDWNKMFICFPNFYHTIKRGTEGIPVILKIE